MTFLNVSKYIINRDVNYKSKVTQAMRVHSTNKRRALCTTVDSADIKHFSKIYKDWWNPEGGLKLLHSINSVRTPFIRDRFTVGKIVENEILPLKNQKILEVGCGGGILTEELAKLGANVTGIDASAELIQVAQEHKYENRMLADNKPTYYITTIEKHANIYENHYDGIVSSEVLEHVNNPELFVKSCVQGLKPGGKILFTTPNRTRWVQFLLIFICEDVLKVIPKGTHLYEKFLTPKELTWVLEKNNCVVDHISGFLCNPLKGTWKTSNSLRMVFALQATKIK